jgi:hydrogenase nickel incorporation protein HypA/HybF
MHELSVTQNLLELATQQAKAAGAKKITTLYLVIGQLSSIVDDSVQFYWDFVTKNTIAAGSKLVFRRVSPKFGCLDCDLVYSPENEDMSCPVCGSVRVKILAGDEFRLEAIDVDT